MQPFYNYQNSMQAPINNPASSKALTKLKTGKLIQAEQMQFSSNRPMMTVPPPPRNLISFGPPPNNVYNNPNNVNFSPPHINHTSSLPNMTLKREGSNLSQYSNSQSSILTQSERIRQNLQPQQNPQQALNISFQKNQNPQLIKPQSALQRTHHASSNGDLMRLRSSSASHFSLNQSEKRAANLESKIEEYHKQILQYNMSLNQKQRKITQLQVELSNSKQRSNELELRLNENYENQKLKDKKIQELQNANKEITSGRTGLQVEKNVKEQKIKNLEGTLQKMLRSKDVEIQSLNQSCTELSKHLQSLHEKYEQQVRKLTQTIQSQQQTINHNKTYFDSLNERMKSYQQHLSSREEEIKEFLEKMRDRNSHIQLIEAENNTLKTDLSSHIQELQTVQQKISEEKSQKAIFEQKYQKLLLDFNNAKKLGQQQIQFLQNKVQESTLEKQRLEQQIQLTKVVTLKRNMVFQRQVIYDLKKQNDQLWAKLIEKSEWNARKEQKDPMYWSKRLSNVVTYNVNSSHRYNAFQQPAKPSTSPEQIDFQQRYRRFVEDLERQQEMASKKITQLNQKQEINNQQDTQFYKNKCLNLEKMVEQHLKINLSLKQQLQKYQLNSKYVDTSSAQVVFLKNQLQKQIILKQTLQRSINLMKTEYEMRFKAAQARVDEIQNQNINFVNNNSYLPNQNLEKLKKLLAQSQIELQRISNENRNLTVQVSEGKKWQSMYEQTKRRYEQMSPITQYNKGSESDELKNQLQNISRLLKQRQADYKQLDRSQIQKCENYEQQLKIKEKELQLMLKDFEKVEKQFSSGRLRYDQLLKDISRLQKQLHAYKTGTTIVNSQMFSYTTNLLRAKLLEVDAFMKQVKQHESRLNLEDDFSKELANQIIYLVQNSQRAIDDCLKHCSQIEANLKS